MPNINFDKKILSSNRPSILGFCEEKINGSVYKYFDYIDNLKISTYDRCNSILHKQFRWR